MVEVGRDVVIFKHGHYPTEIPVSDSLVGFTLEQVRWKVLFIGVEVIPVLQNNLANLVQTPTIFTSFVATGIFSIRGLNSGDNTEVYFVG